MVYVFIFRRDFRIVDNLAYNDMLAASKGTNTKILPIFIFKKDQIIESKNPYFSHNAVQFMIESLRDLSKRLDGKLQLFYTGLHDTNVLKNLHSQFGIDGIWFNEDVSPYARHRDTIIRSWCDKQEIKCHINRDDYVLIPPYTMTKPYQVFSAYYKKYKTSEFLKKNPSVVKQSRTKGKSNYVNVKSKTSINLSKIKYRQNKDVEIHGGRQSGLNILSQIKKGKFKSYERIRDLPFYTDGTTRLSAYLKYGCISVREAYHAVGRNSSLSKQLMWRSFYDQIVWHFPRTLEGQLRKDHKNRSLREKYDKIVWQKAPNNSKRFLRWVEGTTGFPMVDAGMRQLKKTGYMHNRLRMITASFLIKDMFIDWRQGERYFASKLIDYYPSANNQGWTFVSGSGADAQQYNRIFSPWLQSKKFDKDCQYIKAWIPELKDIPSKDIHTWFKTNTKHASRTGYPPPMLSHETASVETKRRYAAILYS